ELVAGAPGDGEDGAAATGAADRTGIERSAVGEGGAAGDDQVAPAADRVAQRAGGAPRVVGGDVEQGPAARGQAGHVGPAAVVDHGQAYVQVRPADEGRLED